MASTGYWGLIFALNRIQHVFWDLWACPNNISKNFFLNFFPKFHPNSMPVCSVFEAFWHVWAKYFFRLQTHSLSLELEHLWPMGKPYQMPRIPENRRFGWILAQKIDGRFTFTTYSKHFFKKASSSSHFGAVFWALSPNFRPWNFINHLTRYTRVV